MAEDAPSVDSRSVIRTRQFRVMLVFAAAIGLLVSAVSWGYLELVHYIQTWVYEDLPKDLGYTALPPGDLGHSPLPCGGALPWLALPGGRLQGCWPPSRSRGSQAAVGMCRPTASRPAVLPRGRSTSQVSSSPPSPHWGSDSCSGRKRR